MHSELLAGTWEVCLACLVAFEPHDLGWDETWGRETEGQVVSQPSV